MTTPFISRRFHFIIDAFDCDVNLLANQDFLEEAIKEITILLEMTILKGPFVAEGIPSNPGLTAFAIIDFSHISIHTFTDSKEFCLDIFSCKQFDYKKLEDYVKNIFKLEDKQIFKSIVRYDQLNIERNKSYFSPKDYINEYYDNLSNENIKLLEWYDKIYSTLSEAESLLEVGGGPTIYQLISAVEKVQKVTFTDYCERNIKVINQWIKKPDNFWDKFIKYVLEIEGKKKSSREIYKRKEKISNVVSNAVISDIGIKNDEFIGKFDIAQSSFCLESSTDDISEFKRMLANIATYLKPNGLFVMCALEGSIAYKVGNKYFPSIYLDKELAKKYLEEAGFRIETIDKIESENSDSSKYHGFLLIKAKKN